MNIFAFFGKIINRWEKEDNMNALYKTALAIAIVGCVNWGLVGIFNFNLVEFLFGDATIITRIVYILVAICGLIDLGIFTKDLDR